MGTEGGRAGRYELPLGWRWRVFWRVKGRWSTEGRFCQIRGRWRVFALGIGNNAECQLPGPFGEKAV